MYNIRTWSPVMPWALAIINSSCFIKVLSLSCVACTAVSSGQWRRGGGLRAGATGTADREGERMLLKCYLHTHTHKHTHTLSSHMHVEDCQIKYKTFEFKHRHLQSTASAHIHWYIVHSTGTHWLGALHAVCASLHALPTSHHCCRHVLSFL